MTRCELATMNWPMKILTMAWDFHLWPDPLYPFRLEVLRRLVLLW